MTTIIVSVVFMLIIFAAMAVGVIFSNKPIAGTCGGLNQFREGDCEICGGDPDKCESSDEFEDSPALQESSTKGYDVMNKND